MIRTRFAPSPTGVLHLGSVRTALFCWLYARHAGGEFVLRIEDTDRERSTPENVEAITDGMAWLGLDADVGPVFQSDRFDRYSEVIADWLATGLAYRCECSKDRLEELREGQKSHGEKMRYDGRCRDRQLTAGTADTVVRFRNPSGGSVIVDDQVRGRVEFANDELDDLIIARSDGSPTYNFTVVVDDLDMGISHVIRGDDHLNNTPRQINMLKAMGATLPVYAHLPMILGADGAKLSKRHGAVDIREYRTMGYLPEAMLNYLVRLGWSHGDQEIFSTAQMIELFDIADINQSASSFNPEKLLWINQQHLMAAPAERLAAMLEDELHALGVDLSSGPATALVVEAYRERATTMHEMARSVRYCFEDFEEIDPKSAKKHLRPVIGDALSMLRQRFATLARWDADSLLQALEAVASECEMNLGKIGQPVRVAVTGGPVSPALDVTLALVGKDRTLKRLDSALQYIQQRAEGVG